MKTRRRIIALLLVTLCFTALVFTASAASYASTEAGEFGVLSGTLEHLIANEYQCEFSFSTTVTKIPGASARLYATVDYTNNATGALLGTENGIYVSGQTIACYYVDLFHMENFCTEGGITIGALGAHEARYTNAYVVYTSRTYNYERDGSG